MRPCLENELLGTMSTIVGWSLWPQKINGERKGGEKNSMGSLPHRTLMGLSTM